MTDFLDPYLSCRDFRHHALVIDIHRGALN